MTVTGAEGPTPALDLAERPAGSGSTVTPHLAARLVRDAAHLPDVDTV